MSCLLYAKDDDTQRQVNIEELYEKEQKRNQKMLSTFNKILNRIHKRIQTVARSKHSDKHVFFNVPEFILGEPNYENTHCIAFLVTQLEENEFVVKYIHPNTLFISWNTFVPSFIRDQVKKKTGLVIDTKGQPIVTDEEAQLLKNNTRSNSGHGTGGHGTSGHGTNGTSGNGTGGTSGHGGTGENETGDGRYKSTEIYKPTGQFVYGSDLFDKIDKRIQK